MNNLLFKSIISAFLALCSLPLSGQTQQEEKTPEEMAYEETIRLEELLKLEPHQAFYVDSILQYNMRALYDEFMALRASGTQEYRVLQQVRDKWNARTDSAFHKVLTPEQWHEFQKSTGKLAKEKAAKRKQEKQEKRKKK